MDADDADMQLGGPSWDVKVGRRDSTTASFSGANNNIPPPTSGLANLTSLFAAQGLSQKDMVALAGACGIFSCFPKILFLKRKYIWNYIPRRHICKNIATSFPRTLYY
jgi:hypothetical protein